MNLYINCRLYNHVHTDHSACVYVYTLACVYVYDVRITRNINLHYFIY